ncbi:GntR family transcriptional regulator [Muricoccus pecuniae]|uniref:DNA-binding GntR family transcriptional regulator n=1 Tax=Muricoccus pecuniae TaxID=693023 RepID=A0A840XW30_9PROT|nr:GntR family transcriptional regulator [Roseomonas pecuniae]MBB5692735.1 DNA-binding GntR family transcriptional regulator [Roseomonas pecuniae]
MARNAISAPEEETVGEAAYRRIRSDIVFGRLTPGQKLGLDRMRDTYGASISTLRELLSRLASEGLIVAEGQRGFEVAPVSEENFREVTSLRFLLEAHAMERSFAAGGLDWEGGVVAAHHKLAAVERRLLAGQEAEVETWKRYDWEFHRALIAACGSKLLLQAHEAIYDRYLRYQMVAVVFRGEEAAAEHRRLLDSALARDSVAARQALAEHLEGCVAHVSQTGSLARFAGEPRRAAEAGAPSPPRAPRGRPPGRAAPPRGATARSRAPAAGG